MIRSTHYALALAGTALSLVAGPAAADRHKQVSAYIELDQILAADLSGDDDVLTYSEVAAGVDASIQTQRAEGQVSYRYERRIGEGDHVRDNDVHTGLARASVKLGSGVALEGGAIATRARDDIRGAAPGVLEGNYDNISQVYALYAGPTLSTDAGPVTIGAAYRYGYTKVESPNSVTSGPGEPRRDYFDSSQAHVVEASAGVAPGRVLPVGVTVSGLYDRETASQLSQRYVDKSARGDVVLPVSRTLALTAGVGYEKIKTSQKDALLDAAGNPVLDKHGRFITAPNSPRRIAYDTDGLIYDAGVVWRPSPRTGLTAVVAHRYGGTSYTGTFSWQPHPDIAFNAAVYDGIETFGHQLRHGLQSLPTNFQTQPGSFGQQFNGCTFGAQPGSGGPGGGAGGCLNDVFQSINTASYRARGIDAVLTATRGRTSYGVGAGYSNRHLYAPDTAPGITIFGVRDESYYVDAFWSYSINRVSGLDATLFGNWYDTDQAGAGRVFNAGATGAYTHQFGRLGTVAQLGVYSYDTSDDDTTWSAQALLGARYQF